MELDDPGADVNERDHNGRTLLHRYVSFRQWDAVKCLISRGADVNVMNNWGSTPLHLAATVGCLEAVEAILVHTNDMNVRNIYRDTPLSIALTRNYEAVAKVLIEKGADLNVKDSYGFTPLHLAVISGSVSMVEIILQRSVDVNARTNRSNTPLHLAALVGSVIIVTLLLNSSAMVNVTNDKKTTPLHLAAFHSRFDVVELLLEHRALVKVQDKLGRTPLQCAVLNYCEPVVELLLMWGHSMNSSKTPGARPRTLYGRKRFLMLMLKLHIATTCIQEKPVNMVVNDLFHVKCINELMYMKGIRFNNRTLFDILFNSSLQTDKKIDLKQLFISFRDPCFINNKEDEKIINDAKHKMSLYYDVLRFQFKKLKFRYTLLNEVQLIYVEVLKLPMELTRRILSYFTNDDLIMMIENAKIQQT